MRYCSYQVGPQGRCQPLQHLVLASRLLVPFVLPLLLTWQCSGTKRSRYCCRWLLSQGMHSLIQRCKSTGAGAYDYCRRQTVESFALVFNPSVRGGAGDSRRQALSHKGPVKVTVEPCSTECARAHAAHTHVRSCMSNSGRLRSEGFPSRPAAARVSRSEGFPSRPATP